MQMGSVYRQGRPEKLRGPGQRVDPSCKVKTKKKKKKKSQPAGNDNNYPSPIISPYL